MSVFTGVRISTLFNWSVELTSLREASHIDFAHKKRQLYVSVEIPPLPLETSKLYIDVFDKMPLSHVFDIWAALYCCL